jgi:proteic killer suppression protein
MIASFADEATEALFHGLPSLALRRLPPQVLKIAARKLDMLHAAAELRDLLVPPGNRLHPLWGDRAGQFAIRVNDQWRIIFRWSPGEAHDVSLTDYH